MDSQITLKNGEKVKVNDHVYCSPNWNVRDGTPYSVARIMEFLLPEGAATGKGKGKEVYTRVRLAWYYRPSDVSDRAVSDSRLLLAAIYSEVCDINQLRAKCYVMHKDKLHDLSGWKKRSDHFYFHRLFDPYIKKEFEVLLTSQIRNLPAHIKDVLLSRYEYIVAEKDVVPDLTDTLRLCVNCEDWCPNGDAVQCASCRGYFHMGCVNPPLIAKPSRGYGWTCAPCSRKHEDQVDSGQARSATPVITKPVKVGRGRGRPRKNKTLGSKVDDDLPVKHYKLWPFRYFGLFTVAEDTLDPNDLIFPRAATRMGPKFQAHVPSSPDDDLPFPSEIEARGGDSTVDILSVVNRMSEEEVAELETYKNSLTNSKDIRSSVDWLTEAIRRLSIAYLARKDIRTVNMKSPFRPDKWPKTAVLNVRYTDREWNHQEQAAFETGIAVYGAELRSVREEVGTRSMPEVVRYYGFWKNMQLKDVNYGILLERKSVRDETYQPPVPSPPAVSDDEGSIVRFPAKGNAYCAACRTRESKVWWKAPKGLPTNILCDSCGLNWRKYADLNARPVREDAPPSSKTRAAEKRDGTPLSNQPTKRAKTTVSEVTSVTSTLPSTQFEPACVATELQCSSCYKYGPHGKILQCQQCSFLIHAGACGAVLEEESVESWVCELCQNEKTLEASLNPDCLLCPKQKRAPSAQKKIIPAPDSYLRACKPTEGQGWVHVLCSVFIPDVSYADSVRLRLVEGISTIPKQRWITTCTLCGESGGAVVRCGNCPKEYHVSCAWKFGHKFGFEIQPVKSSRRDATTMVTFKRETGAMNAVILCKDHSSYRRDVYDICELNDVDETALQVYCRSYKQAQVTQSHALLRKARRLDQILNSNVDGVSQEADPSVDPSCQRCHTNYSPFFYPVEGPEPQEGAEPAWLCHKCHCDTVLSV